MTALEDRPKSGLLSVWVVYCRYAFSSLHFTCTDPGICSFHISPAYFCKDSSCLFNKMQHSLSVTCC